MIFEVIQSLTITMNGFQTSVKTRFDIEFSIHEKLPESRSYIIKKSKINSLPIDDNNYLKVIEDLEWYTYPIKIETNNEGQFLKMLDHKQWLKDWEDKSLQIVKQHNNSDNVKDIRNKYQAIAKDEKAFVANKFKEPFWNLLFFNPPIDNANNPNLGTTLNWNIKSLGVLPCIGKTLLKSLVPEEAIIYFESQQEVTQNILSELDSKINLENVNLDKQKVNLQVAATFDTVQKKMKSKKALFELIIEGVFSYVEETDLILKAIE